MGKARKILSQWKEKWMKNRLSKWWFLVVLAVPFILMFCLHIGIALGNYFGININVPNVDASTWFVFCGTLGFKKKSLYDIARKSEAGYYNSIINSLPVPEAEKDRLRREANIEDVDFETVEDGE